MNTKTPSWDDLRMLLAVHRDKSFLAAGKTLGVAPSTVARRIEALEFKLGRSLVYRANDGARLDPDALRLVALAEQLELGLASLVRDSHHESVAGTVRISLSEGFIRPLLPTLARLRVKYAGLMIELASESRTADVARGETDIAVRVAPSASASTVSKRIGSASAGLFASRDYVTRRLPNAALSSDEASVHDWVGFDRSLDRMPHQAWLYEFGATRFVFRSNSALAIEQAVLSGMGIGLLGEAQARSVPSLVQLDLERAPPSIEIYLVYSSEAKRTPRVRVVANELEKDLRRQLG
jgi:DNA-binding transcriptional LysR family regulator